MKNNVFKDWENAKGLYPPNQVFKKNDFIFLLTTGGNLADNDVEYQNLMTTLKTMEETSFFIAENISTLGTNNKTPFIRELSVDSNFNFFQKIGLSFDPVYGWAMGHFFVYGKSEDWGIYICENPSINIIGCNKKYKKTFQEIYGIIDNGLNELDEFISKEFIANLNLKALFIKNYHLIP